MRFADTGKHRCKLIRTVRSNATSFHCDRSAVILDAVREGFRWLALYSPQGHSIPRCGLLLKVQFLP